ncbi:hypothetical protein F4774DRAFT_389331 [Daldinia eschscholtzii]|nr:hypothetical protein F4774DRAFT_389331 [Daldinia eschscholtzii]
MGLPLWVEPDESGSRAKTAPKSSTDPAATGRSSIRRSTSPRRVGSSRALDGRRRLRDIRAQRLNVLMAQQANNNEDGLEFLSGPATIPDLVSPLFPMVAVRQGQDPPEYGTAAEIAALLRSPRRTIRSSRPSRGEVSSDDELPAFDEDDTRTAIRPRNTDPARPLRSNRSNNETSPVDSDDLDAQITTMQDIYRARARARRFSPTTRINRYVDRFSHLREEDRDLESAHNRAAPPFGFTGSFTDEYINTAPREVRDSLSEAQRRDRLEQRRLQRVRYFDGLGDRDRSLSPEGDGVWSILQSTLTIDPQPPSVGSSFASTTASTIASLNPTVPSSRTSITSPNEEVEPPCDPVGEPEATTEDSSADAEGADRPRRPTPHGRRSYAAVAADRLPGAELSPDDPEWLSGMHRIVSGLASRQDIPDEWWEQAGLSRSMSWGWPS